MPDHPIPAGREPVLARRRLAVLLTLALGLPALALLGRHVLAAPLPALGLASLAWLLWFLALALHAWLWQQATLSDLAAEAYAEAMRARSAATPAGGLRSLGDTPAYASPSWLPGYARTGQRLLLLAGLAAAAFAGVLAWRSTDPLAVLAPDGLRLLAILSALGAAGLAFLATFLRAGGVASAPAGFIPALRLLAGLHGVIALAAAARLFAEVNLDRFLLPLLLLVLGVLLVEALLGLFLGSFRRAPVAQADEPSAARPPLGHSLLLDALATWRHPLDLVVERLQSGLGVRLDTSWIHQFLRRRLAWITAAGLGALWLSTSLTVVPPDSQGVRLRLGRIDGPALPPGLHASLPLPFGRVELVPVARVQELTLGFADDLGGAILWSRKHYEGEQNLLVGDGTELLTINVPIHYRIADAVLRTRASRDPAELLRGVAETRLVGLAVTRDAYRLMLGERAALAAELHRAIQADLDALHSGIEVVWLGFKDIHPPVEVTPAYQEVVSALDERETFALQAHAARAASLPAARQESARTRTEAEASGRERSLLAAADQAPLRALASLPPGALAGWREVRHLEALETVLPRLRSLVVTSESATPEAATLDLRPPTPAAPAPAPVP
jgi:regulator of protease activity HflC (stomatin/prohibitin superfamily)